MDPKQAKPPNDLPGKDGRKRVPLPSEWSNVMDELFEQACRDGAFDNLPGKGKPLKLSKNLFNPEYELAFQLLKDNDYTLPWIAQRSEIASRTGSLRAEIRRSWDRYRVEYHAARDTGIRMSLAAGWRDELRAWGDEIDRINKLIADTNLKQPGERLELFKLSLARELRRAGALESLE
jgi:hypothetical protein